VFLSALLFVRDGVDLTKQGVGKLLLRDEVAIVTGGGRGVGRAVSEALARSGASVVLAARTVTDLESVAAAVDELGGRALVVPTDVTDERAVSLLVAESTRTFGPPTVLVNAAGSWTAVGPVEDSDAERWWNDVEVNLRGTFLCARAVLPGMLAEGKGRIVNVSSYAGVLPRPHATAYASAKAAVLRFTDSLAAELAGRGVLVFAVSPGFVRTRLVEGVAFSDTGRKYLPELAERDDALEPELAGRLVVDIASGRLDSLSGRFLHVLDDVDDLLRRADELREHDLYVLRLRV
jgi:NAD(P)-dependent dehydrogenase (short-subunit alcohol dehydrogenase family)